MLTRRTSKISTLVLALAVLSGIVSIPPARAIGEQYRMGAFPFRSQEGTTISLVLSVGNSTPATTYEFIFGVQDPSTQVWTSSAQRYTTLPTQKEFFMIISYPSPSFNGGGGTTSLSGIYIAAVSQTKPIPSSNVASTFFIVGLTDKQLYQRTETVSIKATGYLSNEQTTVDITRTPSNTVVYSQVIHASSTGDVTASWKIPPNADTTEDYVVRVTGTVTSKTPSDIDSFNVATAPVTVSSLSMSNSSYQRTEVTRVSFVAQYPSGDYATTGTANITFSRPGAVSTSFNVTASYDSVSQTFVATYTTLAADPLGTWTVRLNASGFDDSYGNKGPSSQLSTSFTLQLATLGITITLDKTSFAVNEPIQFKATGQYPGGSYLTTGTVNARLNSGTYNATTPLVYDTALGIWFGTYSPQGTEPPGLWSLTVTGTDPNTPANAGSATRVITLNRRTTGVNIACTPSQMTVNEMVTCTVTVIDMDLGTPMTPMGTVTVSPGFDSPKSCTLSAGTGASAACSVVFTTNSNSQGTNSVTANYSGDTRSSSSTASVTVQVQAPPSNNGGLFSLPLFYFALLALAVAGIIGAFLAFRHKTTHTRLKIDIDAVRSEAGKIENQAFFQSVRDQLTKDKDEPGTDTGSVGGSGDGSSGSGGSGQ